MTSRHRHEWEWELADYSKPLAERDPKHDREVCAECGKLRKPRTALEVLREALIASYGHYVGEANRMTATIRAEDVVKHLRGRGFAIEAEARQAAPLEAADGK